jgi:hypothetical protein
MKELRLTDTEFERLRELQLRLRWDWPAAFSANWKGEIWPFVFCGYTRRQSRQDIRGLSEVVDRLADHFLGIRNEGGRFFIDERGAFYKTQGAQEVQFVAFKRWR